MGGSGLMGPAALPRASRGASLVAVPVGLGQAPTRLTHRRIKRQGRGLLLNAHASLSEQRPDDQCFVLRVIWMASPLGRLRES